MTAYVAAAGGAITGFVATGTGEGALFGAFTAVAALGVSQYLSDQPWAFDSGSFTTEGTIARSVGVGLSSGISSDLQGGKFGHGFFTAGVSSLVSPAISDISDSDYLNAFGASLVGGTLSKATGGKFANGAATAAFSYAMNQVASDNRIGDNDIPLEDRVFKNEERALRYIQRYVEQPEGLEDGGFLIEVEGGIRATRIIGGAQGIDLGTPPDGAVAAWHRHPDLGPGSEHFSLAFRSGSRSDGKVGPFYDFHDGDVAYSYKYDTRFYLIAPEDSLQMINPQDIVPEYFPGHRSSDEMFRLRWKVQ